jgi:hypothetical protein
MFFQPRAAVSPWIRRLSFSAIRRSRHGGFPLFRFNVSTIQRGEAMSEVLRDGGIAHHLDDWGPEGGHDWPYWHHQMWEYVGTHY